MKRPREALDPLEAYHDGELSALSRWRVERRLARDAAARRELESLGAVRELLRELEAEAPAPDLWERIEGRLRVLDAELEAEATPSRPTLPSWLRPVGAGALAAAVAAAALFWSPPEAPTPAVVRWLDTMGQPVMVLQPGEETTIIWLMGPVAGAGDEVSLGGSGAVT